MAFRGAVAAAFLLFLAFASPLFAETLFDFYYLVLMWPGAYCAQSTCCTPSTGVPKGDFSIRGLWPVDTTTGNVVTKCNGDAFQISKLSNLTDELKNYWSNIKCPSNNGVSTWKSAWKTYGVCSNLTQDSYFSTALYAREVANVLASLRNQDIRPSLLNLYNVTSIEKAITEATGAAPVIRCSNATTVGTFQLFEVYICVDKDGETIIECPVKPTFTCSAEILFAPFDTNSLKNKRTANPIVMPLSSAA